MYTYFILQLDVPVIDGCLFVWLFYIYLTVTFFNKNIMCYWLCKSPVITLKSTQMYVVYFILNILKTNTLYTMLPFLCEEVCML